MLHPGESITTICNPPTSFLPLPFLFKDPDTSEAATSHELPIVRSTLEIIQREKKSDLNSAEGCFATDAPVITSSEVLPSPEATELTRGKQQNAQSPESYLCVLRLFKRNLCSVSLGQPSLCSSFFSDI